MSALDDIVNFPVEAFHAGIQDKARAELVRLRADLQYKDESRRRLHAYASAEMDINRQLGADLQVAEEHIAALETAAVHFIGKLKKIHESDEYQAVWQCAHFHRGPYRGESYEDEMNALASLLAAHPAAPETTSNERDAS